MNSSIEQSINSSISDLVSWIERSEYKGYDPFDGLNAPLLRKLTFGSPLLRIVLQQGIRRFPLNLRSLLGILPAVSSKGMSFMARGYLRLYQITGEQLWRDRAKFCLDWLLANPSEGYTGLCWGNHFDYQSRVFYLPAGEPTIVWVALIGHTFLDAYSVLKEEKYLHAIRSISRHILTDYPRKKTPEGTCISYIPSQIRLVHNANMLGASFLARANEYVASDEQLDVAREAVNYTINNQREDGSWFYGEPLKLHWVDNFHTAYVLDSLKHFVNVTNDPNPKRALILGYDYWKKTFIREDGKPSYYSNRLYPIDIQCSSQAIDTLVFFSNHDPDAIESAGKIAIWTVENMQDSKGFFYFRKYPIFTNKTPMQHWGQGTMLCALAGLLNTLSMEGVS